jgi:hypothetical protein
MPDTARLSWFQRPMRWSFRRVLVHWNHPRLPAKSAKSLAALVGAEGFEPPTLSV